MVELGGNLFRSFARGASVSPGQFRSELRALLSTLRSSIHGDQDVHVEFNMHDTRNNVLIVLSKEFTTDAHNGAVGKILGLGDSSGCKEGTAVQAYRERGVKISGDVFADVRGKQTPDGIFSVCSVPVFGIDSPALAAVAKGQPIGVISFVSRTRNRIVEEETTRLKALVLFADPLLTKIFLAHNPPSVSGTQAKSGTGK